MLYLQSSLIDYHLPDFASTCPELIALMRWIFFLDEDVCFTAYLSSYAAFNVPSVIIYNRVITNRGSGYNTADGVFTAPRDGTYLFIWNSETYGGHYCYLNLFKNGLDVGFTAYSDALSGHADSGSMSLVLELTTGDRVWVYNNGNCQYLYRLNLVTFSGCKIWRTKSMFERYIDIVPYNIAKVHFKFVDLYSEKIWVIIMSQNENGEYWHD